MNFIESAPSKPDTIGIEDINTYEKAMDNENCTVGTTTGVGKHHGKKYYDGYYENSEVPIEVEGTLFEKAKIHTTRIGDEAEITPIMRHEYDTIRELLDDYKDRVDGDYFQRTNWLFDLLDLEEMSYHRQLRRWLQTYSFIQRAFEGEAQTYLFSSLFSKTLYDTLEQFSDKESFYERIKEALVNQKTTV